MQIKFQVSPRLLSAKVSKFFFGVCFLFIGMSGYGQCAMCRASLESEGNKTKLQAVNDGIVFLMAIPYVIVAAIGFGIYMLYYKKTKSQI